MSNVLDLNYDNFASDIIASGHTPKKQNDNLFVTKTNNNVKVEIAKSSNSYVVGFGLPVESRDLIDIALGTCGYKQSKKLKTHTMYTYESLSRFVELIAVIEGVDDIGKVKSTDTVTKKIIKDESVIKPKVVKIEVEPVQKTDEELAAIKLANIKRMKEVTIKMKAKGYMPGQYANPEYVGIPEGWTVDSARAEVIDTYKDLESYQAPAFLTKNQVKALV